MISSTVPDSKISTEGSFVFQLKHPRLDNTSSVGPAVTGAIAYFDTKRFCFDCIAGRVSISVHASD